MPDQLQDEGDIIPWDEPARPVGQLCYEAWAAALGWQFRRITLPRWAELFPGERDAFTAGAEQVMQKGWTEAADGSSARRRRHVR